MIKYNDNLVNGINELVSCDSSMMMDVEILKLEAGEMIEIIENKKEVAILMLTGSAKWEANNIDIITKRESVFKELPYVLHFSCNSSVTLNAIEESEILIQKTKNDNEFAMKLYEPSDIKVQNFGENVWDNTALRQIRVVFDYKIAPYSNMVLGEVITYPGKWSSYTPHHHQQPEVYFYKFDRPEGFGAGFVEDKAYKIRNNASLLIEGGLSHPQVTAPGFPMYYCWMIPHLEDNPWEDRIVVDEYKWLDEKDCKYWDGSNE